MCLKLCVFVRVCASAFKCVRAYMSMCASARVCVCVFMRALLVRSYMCAGVCVSVHMCV